MVQHIYRGLGRKSPAAKMRAALVRRWDRKKDELTDRDGYLTVLAYEGDGSAWLYVFSTVDLTPSARGGGGWEFRGFMPLSPDVAIKVLANKPLAVGRTIRQKPGGAWGVKGHGTTRKQRHLPDALRGEGGEIPDTPDDTPKVQFDSLIPGMTLLSTPCDQGWRRYYRRGSVVRVYSRCRIMSLPVEAVPSGDPRELPDSGSVTCRDCTQRRAAGWLAYLTPLFNAHEVIYVASQPVPVSPDELEADGATAGDDRMDDGGERDDGPSQGDEDNFSLPHMGMYDQFLPQVLALTLASDRRLHEDVAFDIVNNDFIAYSPSAEGAFHVNENGTIHRAPGVDPELFRAAVWTAADRLRDWATDPPGG